MILFILKKIINELDNAINNAKKYSHIVNLLLETLLRIFGKDGRCGVVN